MTNTRRTQLSAADQSMTIATAPFTIDVLGGAISENAEVQAAVDWLNEGMSQVDEMGQRVVRPPADAENWEEIFGR